MSGSLPPLQPDPNYKQPKPFAVAAPARGQKMAPDQVRTLLQENLPDWPAASIAGSFNNFGRESGFDPTNATGDGGTSGGFAQWHNDPSKGLRRWDELKDFAKARGTDWTDPITQVKFYDYDMKKNFPKAYAQLHQKGITEEEATAIIKDYYEMPKGSGPGGSFTASTPKYGFSGYALREHENQPDTDIMYVPTAKFLSLAPDFEGTDKEAKADRSLRKSLARGDKIEAIPSLEVTIDAGGARVTGYDGRHRALLAQENGVDLIPVAIKRNGPPGAKITELQGMQPGTLLPYNFQRVPGTKWTDAQGLTHGERPDLVDTPLPAGGAPDAPPPPPVPLQDEPGYTYGSVLPMKQNQETGDRSLAFPEAVRSIVRGAYKGGQMAQGQRPVAVDPDVISAATMGATTLPAPANINPLTMRLNAPSQFVPGTVAGAVAALPGRMASGAGSATGRAVSDIVGSLGTHTGGESIRRAFQAGLAGGEKSRLFLDQMRGNAPIEQVIDTAQQALRLMREERSAAYESGMVDIRRDKAVLDFNGIDDALTRARAIAQYEGVTVNPEALAKLGEIEEAVNLWRNNDPAKFHTVQGFDKLKQRIGSILESTSPHTRASTIVGDVYSAAKSTIVAQAPEYARVMKDYQEASDSLRELQGTFSIPDGFKRRALQDTSLRKLQSIMRNNVNTNYGMRLLRGEKLDELSGGALMPQIAGQSLNTWTPRGLGNVMAGGTGLAAFLGHPALLWLLPFQSPRMMGEAARAAGATFRVMGMLPQVRAALSGQSAAPRPSLGPAIIPPALSGSDGMAFLRGNNPQGSQP